MSRVKTIAQINERIATLEQRAKVTQRVLDGPFNAAGSMVTGRSNRPRSLDRQLDAENGRHARAFNAYRWALQEIKRLTIVRDGMVAGELHPDGRRRADAPSRARDEVAVATYADWFRTVVKKGDKVAIAANPQNWVVVLRLNRRSITSEQGINWTYGELIPMLDGKRAMTVPELAAAFKKWKRELKNE